MLETAAAESLLARARAAREHAYAPYSGFAVGAALLADDGTIWAGCNVENASYPLTVCAERTAIGSAIAAGARRFVAIAVVGPRHGEPCTPCGGCRQVLWEFAPELQVITEGREGEPETRPLRALLPAAFGPDNLTPGS